MYYLPDSSGSPIQIYNENDDIWTEFESYKESGFPNKNCMIYLGNNELFVSMNELYRTHNYKLNLDTKVIEPWFLWPGVDARQAINSSNCPHSTLGL